MAEVYELLRRAVEDAAPRLRQVSDAASLTPRAPGAWTPREIVGHLIDSACNNHRRFVLAQSQDDLVFPGYDQEAWVRSQRYNDAAWADLVGLWRAYNLHIARLMECAPEEARTRPRTNHTLDKTAWQKLSPGEPATLDSFMRDYVAHLAHHVGQILPGYNL